MITDKYGQHVYNEDDVVDIIMQGIDIYKTDILISDIIKNKIPSLIQYKDPNLDIVTFDKKNQQKWFMPLEYMELDIASYVLGLCDGQAELQRCGEELIMYQDRELFDLLKYMKYLVDVMKKNNIIWGVGRGSSVSSYVLYKLEVHKVDSMFYKLNANEFLR
jgi:DNA polymerase III alpha subunit